MYYLSHKKFFLSTLTLLSLAGILIFFYFYSTNSDSIEGEYQKNSVPMSNGDDHYRWKANTDVTVINYFSADCPHCREIFLWEDEYRKLYESKFTLIYRHSPLPKIQPLSVEKAFFAECVYRQSGDEGMFNFIKDVFTYYKKDQSDNEWARLFAEKHITRIEEFNSCVVGEGRDSVVAETKNALAHEVYSTPTISVFKAEEEVLRLNRTEINSVRRLYDSLRTNSSL